MTGRLIERVVTPDWTPDAPDENVASVTVDNGDGTVTRTTYDADGNVTSTEVLKGLPIPPEPSARERLDALPDEKLARLVDLLEDDTKAAALVDVVEKEATQPRSVSR